MKYQLPVLAALVAGICVPLASAQAPPPPLKPAPAPGAPPTLPLPLPGAPPVAAEPAAPAKPSAFPDAKERRSYGLGSFLGGREKNTLASQPDRGAVKVDELLAGLHDGLTDAKSPDYASGLAMAAQIKRAGVEIDAKLLAEALRTVLENKESKMPQEEVQAVMTELNNELQQKQMARQKAEADKNLAAATSFLETNGKAEGVVTTASGLQYKVEKEGDGPVPADKDVLTLNLRGTNTEGQEFEKSPEGKPSRRPMASLVKGLQEGVKLMKAGGKVRFWVPPALGYGESARGAMVKANSVLIFDLELISSEAPPPPQPQVSGIVDSNGNPVPTPPQRKPVTAVTPPVSVEIPPAAPKAPPAPAPAK